VLNGEGARSSTESFVLSNACALYVINFNRANGNAYIKENGADSTVYLNNMDRSTEVVNGKQ
jgi:hypothetical protein